MSRDPFEVLGVTRDATLAEVREAYRRTVELFHPDRLQGVRDAVREEAARRLAEANEAMRSVQAAFGRPLRAAGHGPAPARHGNGPSDEATRAEARLYDAQLRELDADGAYVPGSKVVFGGAPAERVLAELRHRFRREGGPIRMVDWGSYAIELDGDEMRTFLAKVFGPQVAGGYRASAGRALGDRLPVVVDDAALPVAVADAVVHLRGRVRYSLTADVY
jgi:curved DNA-binding protein CbpA